MSPHQDSMASESILGSKVSIFLSRRNTCLSGCSTILPRHCERPKGARQSLYFQCVMRLPLGHELDAEWLRSFHSLAMTIQHSLYGGGEMIDYTQIKVIFTLVLDNNHIIILVK
jgi:hypothetical protein